MALAKAYENMRDATLQTVTRTMKPGSPEYKRASAVLKARKKRVLLDTLSEMED